MLRHWHDYFQNDCAARIDRTLLPYATANLHYQDTKVAF